MKKLFSRLTLSCVLLVLSVLTLRAANPTITVTLSDYTLDYSGSGYVVHLVPIAATGGTSQRALTDNSGIVSFSSVKPGRYSVSIESAGVPTYEIKVPSSSSTIAASTIIVSPAYVAPSPYASAEATAQLRAWSLLSPVLTNSAGVLQPNGIGANTNAIKILQSGGIGIGGEGTSLIGIRGIEAKWNTDLYDGSGILKLDLFNTAGVEALSQLTSTVGDGPVARAECEASDDGYATFKHLGFVVTGTSAQLEAFNEVGDLFRLNPTAPDGTTPYTFYTSLEHTSGNLVEWGNSNALKAAIRYDGAHVFADATVQTTAAKAGANNYTAYAAGTAYSLTTTPAALTFGTTSPAVTIVVAGTYLIQSNVGVKYTGLTYVGAQTATVKVRRTNNTPADLTKSVRTVELPVLTTFTGGDVFTIPPVIYTAAAGDILEIYGSISADPGAGSTDATSAEIVAVRLQ